MSIESAECGNTDIDEGPDPKFNQIVCEQTQQRPSLKLNLQFKDNLNENYVHDKQDNDSQESSLT
jgi:hypothetical protein